MAGDMSKWNAAEQRYRQQGMSSREIKKHRDAYFAKRRPEKAGSSLREALGSGLARGAGELLSSRRRREEATGGGY